MDETLSALLKEMQAFMAENDARATDRKSKMMNITPETGAFLAFLVRLVRPHRILEIGTSNGYSTLWLADAARDVGGKVTTVERLPEKAAMARANFSRGGLSPWIQLHNRDAADFVKEEHPAEYQFIFLDAERGEYVAMWPDLQRILAPGGLIVADNATSHPGELAPWRELASAATGYTTCLVPVGKGELLVLKPSE